MAVMTRTDGAPAIPAGKHVAARTLPMRRGDTSGATGEATAPQAKSRCSYAGTMGGTSRHNHAHDGHRCDIVIKDTDAMTLLVAPFLRYSPKT